MPSASLNFSHYLIMRESTLLKNSNPSFDIGTWYQTQLGQTVFKLEQQQLRLLPRAIFNENILQLSAAAEPFSALNIPASHLFLISTNKPHPNSINAVQSHLDQLPFPNESVHTVILPHVLEFQMDPHIILTEAWRVLEPEGHLIILGFNPWSLWGVTHLMANQILELPAFTKFYSMAKLNYWLTGLNAEIILKRSFLFATPFIGSRCSNTMQNAEKALTWLFPNNGGINLLVAKKQMILLTPIRMRWNWREIFADKTLIEPTTRNAQRG